MKLLEYRIKVSCCVISHEKRRQILDLFRWQAENNPVYRKWLQLINTKPKNVNSIDEIPFLPIEFFKTFEIKTGTWSSEQIFKSSGTTSLVRSHHHVDHLARYLTNTQYTFEGRFGPLSNWYVLALLPGYDLQSSLIQMVTHFMKRSIEAKMHFFNGRDEFLKLRSRIEELLVSESQVMIFGVTHSLIEFANQAKLPSNNISVIETGGMKGKGEEITREELHAFLKEKLRTPLIYSEYGMTELFSQAYTSDAGLFLPNDTFVAVPGDVFDPLSMGRFGQTCRLNIIDLANTHSCAFIATSDVGRVYESGSFEVLGRMDHAELRGCNLMYTVP